MVEIKEVKGKKMIKEFIEFPLKLYKDNPYFVPPLYSDEKSIFKKKYVYSKTCECVYYNAYENGKIVGRICGFIQKQANEKNNQKRIRFSRFDVIDSQEVADKLFNAVIEWGKSKGMDTICGPLGFSDLEREGLLIEGFNEYSTFEEQYNYEYYAKLIENVGFQKEVDWIESKIYRPKERNLKLKTIAEKSMAKCGLKFIRCKTIAELLNNYADKIFHCLDVCYKDVYGTVDFTDEMKKQMIFQFKILIDVKYVGVLVDKDDNVVGFGLCFPSFGTSLNKSGGRLTIPTLFRLFKTIKHPKVLDLALVAVMPEYQRTGVSAYFIDFLYQLMTEDDIEHCETNLNLEDNYNVRSLWKYFDCQNHKRRRAYVKKID